MKVLIEVGEVYPVYWIGDSESDCIELDMSEKDFNRIKMVLESYSVVQKELSDLCEKKNEENRKITYTGQQVSDAAIDILNYLNKPGVKLKL